MDFCNLYSYNPLAPDYLNGLDPGTPDGFEDLWAEHAINIVTTPQVPLVTVALLFPWPFLIRAVYGTMDYNGFGVAIEPTYNFLVIDPDGERLMDTRARGELQVGVGNAPFPVFPDKFIPQGRSLTIEFQDETGNTGQIFQLCFVGVRRRKVAQVTT